VSDDGNDIEQLEATVRSLRDEVERLKAEIARLRRERDERPPHYL
jgi:cell division protein FtsB